MKNNDTYVELVNITWDVVKEINRETAKIKSEEMKLEGLL
jgi:hypothetical protein